MYHLQAIIGISKIPSNIVDDEASKKQSLKRVINNDFSLRIVRRDVCLTTAQSPPGNADTPLGV